MQPSLTHHSKYDEDKRVIEFFCNRETWNIIVLQTTKSQVWTQPARRVCPSQVRAINKRERCQVACGKWDPWQSSHLVDNSDTHPDLQSPPTVLEKDTGTWTSPPSPSLCSELHWPLGSGRAPAPPFTDSSLLKYSNSFPSLGYVSVEIFVRIFLLEL